MDIIPTSCSPEKTGKCLIWLSIISFLACAKNGVIWSSCSPDFGTQGVVDRFKQIEPCILITSDHYFYNGKRI